MDSMKPAIEKLKPEEKELLAAYIMRYAVGAIFAPAFGVKAEPIPDGMTIGKSMKEQHEVIERQKAEDATKRSRERKSRSTQRFS